MALTFNAQGQATNGSPRIGYLSAASAETDQHLFLSFVDGLKELGYLPGKNIIIERRHGDKQQNKLPQIAAELSRSPVDVFVVYGDAAILAAKATASNTPIVFTVHADPVAESYVASLARPGGRITGMADLHSVIVTKRLELLKEIVPSASQIAVLRNGNRPTHLRQLKEVEKVAPAFGTKIESAAVNNSGEIRQFFLNARKHGFSGILVLGDPMFRSERQLIANLASKARIPAIYTVADHVEAGGLMSYGANFADLWRRAATYVDKILRGAKPADLPIEQPTKFDLVINLKTAKQIGLTIPPNVLARADRVIR